MAAITTPFGMLSFPNIFKARPPADGAEPRFSINIVFDEEAQKTAAFAELKKAVDECVKEKWGDKPPKNLRNPLRDAGEKDYGGYDDGKIFINAWTKTPPGIVGPDCEDILDANDVWAGQLARATVNPFAYDTSGNKGVAFGLENIQIGKFDMPRMDGRVAANKAFGAAEVSEGNFNPFG
jgi:hypothetical protein